jgi:hypothetical protein
MGILAVSSQPGYSNSGTGLVYRERATKIASLAGDWQKTSSLVHA